MVRITLEEAQKRFINKIQNKTFIVPLTSNKGRVGNWIEEKLGIENSQNHLDCIDGEIKSFPLKKLKNGLLSPKETIAITMIKNECLLKTCFSDSKLFSKIRNMLFIPYYRNGDLISFFDANRFSDNFNGKIFTKIEKDYNVIKQKLITTGKLESKDGMYIQARTKGRKKSTSRAFYFKTAFIKLLPTLISTNLRK